MKKLLLATLLLIFSCDEVLDNLNPDVTSPAVVITFPSSEVPLTAPTTVKAQVSDNGDIITSSGAISYVKFLIDGAEVLTDTIPPYEYEWDVCVQATGTHTITVIAEDMSSNIGLSEVLSFTINASYDCALVCGGDKLLDNCDVCDADTTNDCPKDCDDVWGGDAVLDECGVCNNYDTQPAFPYGTCDCAGSPDGTATTDNCGTCDTDNANDCNADCNGVFGGDGIDVDSDGVCDDVDDCIGQYDACNICNGDGKELADVYVCENQNVCVDVVSTVVQDNYNNYCVGGVCHAQLCSSCPNTCAHYGGSCQYMNIPTYTTVTTEECGWQDVCEVQSILYCTEGTTTDCANVINGVSVLDNCNVCDSDSTNNCVKDECDVWGGDNSTCVDSCGIINGDNSPNTGICDCNATPNGTATIDNCNVCSGGTTNITACVQDCAGNWGGTMTDANSDGFCDDWESITSVTDIDGNTYNTVRIETQLWMKENLKVTKYNNGIAIPNVTDTGTWETLASGAYCDYANEPNNSNTYGRLYNWYTVDDSREVCPEGWGVPNYEDWHILAINNGGSCNQGFTGSYCDSFYHFVGGKLKETGYTHWCGYAGNCENDGATNESGFTALPGGRRKINGGGANNYADLGFVGVFWSETLSSETMNTYGTAYSVFLSNQTDDLSVGDSGTKQIGMSIRCIKSAP